jgi:hypothetical protein
VALRKHARKNVSLDKGAKLAEVIAIKALAAFPNVSAAFSQTACNPFSELTCVNSIYGDVLTWLNEF